MSYATDDRAVAFLYTLMRDHLPVGVVTGVIQELESKGLPMTFMLSDEALAEIAKRHAMALRRRT